MVNKIKGVLIDVESCEVKTCTISCNKDTGFIEFEGILKANYLRASRRPIPGVMKTRIIHNDLYDYKNTNQMIPSYGMFDESGKLIPETTILGNIFICSEDGEELCSLTDKEIEIIFESVCDIKDPLTLKEYKMIGFTKEDIARDPIEKILSYL